MQAVPRRIAVITIGALVAVGCGVNSGLERLSQARHCAADLLVQFTKAAQAANRAVMADTDEASVAFAREAEQAKQAVQTNIDALQPLLEGLGYTDEVRLLKEFVPRFAEYRELDRSQIAALSRRNTNVRFLARSLTEKGKLIHACEDRLLALRDALAKRGFTGTR